MRPKKAISLKSYITNTLRKASYRWKPRTEAMQAARVERGRYKCAFCGNIFGNKEISLDHINPVVPVTGFTTWDDYINRMFCDTIGFQVLCKTCHDGKTATENSLRKANRKLDKKRK